MFKLLELFKFNCFTLNGTLIYKSAAGVHEFTFSRKKKILQPLITFMLIRQIYFSEKLSIFKHQHCVATLRYGKQLPLLREHVIGNT